MLEQLFSSRTRVKLLKKFLLNPESKFFVRELTREIDERINSVRRELENLVSIGFLITFNQEQKKYYQVNKDFLLYPEIEALIIKSQGLIEDRILERIRNIKQIKYCLLTGKFVRRVDTLTDILVVGDKIPVDKLKNILKLLEKNFDQEINYTILSPHEFQARSQMTDRFIYNILNGQKIVVVDKIFRVKK